MMSTINYKDTLFKRANLTPIRGKTTFEMLHKIQNEMKVKYKSLYSTSA